MSSPRPILHTLASGGSGTGVSFYNGWGSGCPKSAALYEQAAEEGRTFLAEKGPLAVGTIFHAFMEMHFNRALRKNEDPKKVRFSDVVDQEARFEAERLFRAWREQFPSPNEFGKVLEVEDLHPTTRAKEVGEAVGIFPFNYKPDLVTNISADDAKRLHATHEVHGRIKPGRWITDHKTEGKRDGMLIDRSLNDLRFAAYIQAWNAEHPKKPVNGIIRNTWFKYNSKNRGPEGLLIIVPPPSRRQIKSLHSYYSWVVEVMTHHRERAVPSDNNCYRQFGKPCRWLMEGVCNRS